DRRRYTATYSNGRPMLQDSRSITRREALAVAACGFAAAVATSVGAEPTTQPTTAPAEPIIDIHQHTTYRGRSNERMLFHQRKMGITQTIMLPSGHSTHTASKIKGVATGLYVG